MASVECCGIFPEVSQEEIIDKIHNNNFDDPHNDCHKLLKTRMSLRMYEYEKHYTPIEEKSNYIHIFQEYINIQEYDNGDYDYYMNAENFVVSGGLVTSILHCSKWDCDMDIFLTESAWNRMFPDNTMEMLKNPIHTENDLYKANFNVLPNFMYSDSEIRLMSFNYGDVTQTHAFTKHNPHISMVVDFKRKLNGKVIQFIVVRPYLTVIDVIDNFDLSLNKAYYNFTNGVFYTRNKLDITFTCDSTNSTDPQRLRDRIERYERRGFKFVGNVDRFTEAVSLDERLDERLDVDTVREERKHSFTKTQHTKLCISHNEAKFYLDIGFMSLHSGFVLNMTSDRFAKQDMYEIDLSHIVGVTSDIIDCMFRYLYRLDDVLDAEYCSMWVMLEVAVYLQIDIIILKTKIYIESICCDFWITPQYIELAKRHNLSLKCYSKMLRMFIAQLNNNSIEIYDKISDENIKRDILLMAFNCKGCKDNITFKPTKKLTHTENDLY